MPTTLLERPPAGGRAPGTELSGRRTTNEPLEGGGGDALAPAGGGHGDGGGSRQWPLLPALVVAGAIGALLTFLGMLTQIWANLAGAQLPGA